MRGSEGVTDVHGHSVRNAPSELAFGTIRHTLLALSLVNGLAPGKGLAFLPASLILQGDC